MVNTVIFDMDGVIVDTEPVHRLAYYRHFDELGISVTEQMYATFTGNSTKNVYEKIRAAYEIHTGVPQLVARKRSIFYEMFEKAEAIEMIEGVHKLIQDLHEGGFQLLLASSSARQTIEKVFDRFGLHTYFAHITSGEEFVRSKPDPAIFLHAWELSKAAKSECIVIEDSTNGIAAAKAAGLYCVGYESTNTKLQDLSKADIVVGHFDELSPVRISQLIP